ncbi:tetratricopeptide repeat protein [Hufsiella ginkgonis]|uniref:DUF560 domain-containing protein n=1 Tax=Hufsiella ginkgonis TaxID=2695274 RepID=A0A7K1Y1C1_9SPHI|nr:hypothetical protein [Hufsiella ginkgonis]MXV16917.1 hypothetical protein [Hufsiella ginkgonis]
MAIKRALLTFVLLGAAALTRAQQADFRSADSVSLARYNSANWRGLVDYARTAIAAGNDFPALRLRAAYAEMMLGRYSAALVQYQAVLKQDDRNQTALYFLSLCNSNLNRDNEADYFVRNLENKTVGGRAVRSFAITRFGIETSVKMPQIVTRGNASYTRAALKNRIGYSLSLDQSLSYFGQAFPGDRNRQFEYYGKLQYMPVANLSLLGAFHYLNSSFIASSTQNAVAFGGLKYSFAYGSLQADASTGKINGENSRQYNAALSYYPLGSLALYGASRVSLLTSGDRQNTVFSQSVGFKTGRKTWFDGLVVIGDLPGFAEADNLYIFNSIDVTTLKIAATGYYLINPNVTLYLNLLYEQKLENTNQLTYRQNSITAGLTWKF